MPAQIASFAMCTNARRYSLVGVILLGSVAWAACSGSGGPRQPALDRTFRCIQVHEAKIERARALVVGQRDTSCTERCAASEDADAHEARLCGLAARAEDNDALARCELARRNARAIAGQAEDRCRCTHSPNSVGAGVSQAETEP